MKWVNRAVVIIRIRQPFIDWINNTPELDMQEDPISLSNFTNECTVLLLPDIESLDEVEAYLGPIKGWLFDMELAGWYTDPSVWPERRDAATFDTWFDLDAHIMIYDLFGDEPLLEYEQAWRVMELLENATNECEALTIWRKNLEEELVFPFFAEVQESYILGPLCQGDRVRVSSLTGSDPLYGVVAQVHKGSEDYHFPLCNLPVMNDESNNRQLVDDYLVCFRSR
jgi:hypothetical protein